MIDYEISRFTRRCAASDRELQPGETYYSVLLPSGSQVLRQDISAAQWKGPPENALGWWKATMADTTARKPQWAPHDVMLDFFEGLESDPSREDLRYVLALLLVRRRVLRLEAEETDASGRQIQVLDCPRKELQYRVAVVLPEPARAAELQAQLSQLLQQPGAGS
ncbi:hypothetical protein ETAA8_31800 [Anatilimnocola aggregata]|uniref:Uncharacterized protein n=1 Tax=Anatilimnocola aggregata TaxID=2528021 RepID=A0A517YCW2_9BACT|nr:hypothetical protein [Anatilimnocola aggregata]QDU28087.1 hypothetical protein ETAA8_31800 [Anatilimnocola aggregata]